MEKDLQILNQSIKRQTEEFITHYQELIREKREKLLQGLTALTRHLYTAKLKQYESFADIIPQIISIESVRTKYKKKIYQLSQIIIIISFSRKDLTKRKSKSR